MKKITPLIVILLLILVYLTGCASADKDTDTNTDNSQALSGKQQLFALVREAYNEKVTTGKMRAEKTGTITFTTSDSFTYRDLAREVGISYNSFTIYCNTNWPANKPPESLGCSERDQSVTPTADTQSYVLVACYGTTTACSATFNAM